ncbi:MAG: hypothetical protein R3E39_27955 [Anaerolineae bacterium]
MNTGLHIPRYLSSAALFKMAAVLLFAISGLTVVTPLLAQTQRPDNRLLFWSRRPSGKAVYALDTQRHLVGRLLSLPADLLVLAPPAYSSDARILSLETLSPDAHLGIVVLQADGGPGYRSTPGVEDRMARVSPDGQQVAFFSNRNGSWQPYVMNSNGSDLQRITMPDPAQSARSLLWSPDQRWLMLRTWQSPGPSSYWLMDVVHGTSLPLPDVAELGRELAWSPDGAHIAFRTARDHNVEIYVYDVATGTAANITLNPATDFQPAWSPDSRHLVFVSDRAGRGDLYTVDTDCIHQLAGCGTAARRVTWGGAWGPVWSPDGQSITYYTHAASGVELYAIDADGGDARLISALREDWMFLGWAE